jgi:hypothetical protein
LTLTICLSANLADSLPQNFKELLHPFTYGSIAFAKRIAKI